MFGFSKQSRKRLLEYMARLDCEKYFEAGGQAVFVTYTYPRDFPSDRKAKRHLRALLMRVARRWRLAAGIWRMEHQQRGAPHFHIILFGIGPADCPLVRSLWAKVIGYAGGQAPLQVRAEPVTSWRKLQNYVAKYCAKSSGEAERGLDNVTYLHAPIGEAFYGDTEVPGGAVTMRGRTRSDTEGRVWGWFHKRALPWGSLDLFPAIPSTWLTVLKRAANRFLRASWKARKVQALRENREFKGRARPFRLQGSKRVGFSLFSDNPERWFDLACAGIM